MISKLAARATDDQKTAKGRKPPGRKVVIILSRMNTCPTPQAGPHTLSYAELTQRFPPRMIHDERGHHDAQAQVLLISEVRRPLSADEAEYVSLLRLLIKRYEEPQEKSRPLTLLKNLLAEQKLRTKDLSRIIGKSIPLCSMILNGQRAITREHASRLGHYFGKQPTLFMA